LLAAFANVEVTFYALQYVYVSYNMYMFHACTVLRDTSESQRAVVKRKVCSVASLGCLLVSYETILTGWCKTVNASNFFQCFNEASLATGRASYL